MKKIFIILALLITFTTTISASPIKVTLSDGTTVILESEDYATMDELLAAIRDLENNLGTFGPAIK